MHLRFVAGWCQHPRQRERVLVSSSYCDSFWVTHVRFVAGWCQHPWQREMGLVTMTLFTSWIHFGVGVCLYTMHTIGSRGVFIQKKHVLCICVSNGVYLSLSPISRRKSTQQIRSVHSTFRRVPNSPLHREVAKADIFYSIRIFDMPWHNTHNPQDMVCQTMHAS